MRRVIHVSLVILPCIVIGLGVGDMAGQAIPGGVTGLLAGTPLALFVITGRRRWLAMSVLAVGLGIAYFLGGWVSTLLAAGIALVTMFMMAAVLREFYNEGVWEAFYTHLCVLVGRVRGFQVIANGRTIIPSNAEGTLMGPRLLVIRPFNAAILEWGSKQTKITGPTIYRTRLYEYVADIFDLGPNQRQLTVEDVLTADGAEVNINCEATFGINLPEDKRSGARPFEEADQATLTALRGRYTDWRDHAIATIESCLRAAVHELELHKVLARTGYEDMVRDVVAAANAELNREGIQVHGLVVKSVVPKTEVRDTLGTVWQDAERNAMEVKRASALRDVVALIASVYAEARQHGLTEEAIAREVLRHTVQQIAEDHPEALEMRTEVQGLVYELMRWLR